MKNQNNPNKFKVYSIDSNLENNISHWIGEYDSQDDALNKALTIIKNELQDAARNTESGNIITLKVDHRESDNGLLIHYQRRDRFESRIYIVDEEIF